MIRKTIITLSVLLVLILTSCTTQQTPTGISVIGSESAYGNYPCTSEQCQVNCKVDCEVESPSSRVLVRTTDTSYSTGNLAVDTGKNGNLQPYKNAYNNANYRCSSISNAWTPLNITTSDGFSLYRYKGTYCSTTALAVGDLILAKPKTTYYYDFHAYKSDSTSTIPLSNLPLSEYAGKESYSSNLYNCEVPFKISGVLKENIVYSSNIKGSKSSSSYNIASQIQATCLGTPNGQIFSTLYGTCGNCNPTTFTPTCLDAKTLQKCALDSMGCGLLQNEALQDNFICINGVKTQCNDNDICTTDTRTGTQTQCSYTPISNCCRSLSDCDDSNLCTTDTCTSNRCNHVPVTTCCIPSCDENHECVNQNCQLKKGCKYNNPTCTSPKICNPEIGTGGECVCPTDGEFCPSSSLGQKRCSHFPEGTQECVQSGDCYKWSTNIAECPTDFICVGD